MVRDSERLLVAVGRQILEGKRQTESSRQLRRQLVQGWWWIGIEDLNMQWSLRMRARGKSPREHLGVADSH